jgi:2,3-bisphosphoglycerate-dependent phosphoglycerate mutase
MTSVYLIRHGDYIDDQVNGHGPKMDLGLSPDGRNQAEALKERLNASRELRSDVFLSSTERRALETAEVIAGILGQPVTRDKDLEEWRSDDGTVDPAEFMAQWKSLTERQRPFHRFVAGCETGIEFSTRVHTALHRIVTQHAGKTVVLMTHGGFIQVAFQFFFGYGDATFRRAYPAAGHTSITHWRKESSTERWVLESSNDRHHLQNAGPHI